MAKKVKAEGESVATTNGIEVTDVKVVRHRKAPPIPGETPQERFRRLANVRVPNAIKRLRHVANLFRGAQYDSTPEQKNAVYSVLNKALTEVEDAMSQKVKKEENWSI